MRLFELIAFDQFQQYIPAVVKQLAGEIGLSSTMDFNAMNDFIEEFGNQMDDDDLNTSPYGFGKELKNNPEWNHKFHEWIPHWLEGKVREKYEEVLAGAKVANNMVQLYRVIDFGADWYPDQWLQQPIGIYWSYDMNAAEAHWAHGHDYHWLIEASIPISSIDWVTTLVHLIVYEEELEIRVQAGSPILVTQIYVKEDWENSSAWKHPDEFDPSKPPFEPTKAVA